MWGYPQQAPGRQRGERALLQRHPCARQEQQQEGRCVEHGHAFRGGRRRVARLHPDASLSALAVGRSTVP